MALGHAGNGAAGAYSQSMETKRDFDPNVGGGVDRDKLTDSDFAGKNRSFPIVKPGDVTDALSSIGRAGPDNYSHDVLKANILKIAKRKGFPIPKSDEKAGSMTQTKAWVNLAGSYEATQALLGDALDRWMDQLFPGMMCWNWCEATFPGYAIVGVGCSQDGDFDGDGCNVEYWKVPYTVEDDSTVTLGDPTAIDIRGVAVDRPDDDSEAINFLPAANVVAKSLAFKNASRLHRHYALLAWSGVDLSGVGLSREDLMMAPEGLSNIPDAGSADFRTGQEDETQPGTVSDIPGKTEPPAWMSAPGHAGDQPMTQLPAWYQGTYYVDNDSNLVPAALGANVVNQPAGDQTSGPVPSSLYTGHHYGDQTAAPVTAVGTTMDAGTLTLASRGPGETKNATRIRKRARLLGILKGQKYKFGAAPIGEAGAKVALSESDLRLLAILPELQQKASEFSTAVKEGRMLNAANANRLLAAHSAINDILTQSGVVSSEEEPENSQGGKDEEGVSIEPVEAKAGLPVDMVMQWQRLRSGVTSD